MTMTPAAAAPPLITLLTLEERAFATRSARDLAFVMVNDTHGLAPYRLAALHVAGQGVVAVSATSMVEAGSPFVQWLSKTCRMVEAGTAVGPEVTPEWDAWLPPNVLWLPLTDGDGRRIGTLMLAREEVWTEAVATLVQRLAKAYAVVWAMHERPGTLARLRAGLVRVPRWRWLLVGGVLAVLMFPVRQSVLAPGEIVATDPVVVRAPLDGVVENIEVRPNAPVTAGQVLFELDRTSISGTLEVAAKALETATAELDQATQQSFADPRAKARLTVLQARRAEKEAEVARLTGLLERTRVRASVNGVAVVDAPSEWVGRPVSVGEKVLSLADPEAVEVEAWLAPADVIGLEEGAPVTMFLNTDPLAPVDGRLSYVAYRATLQPDGRLAHRVKATLTESTMPPRLGLKGTARLDGARVSLGYLLLRRPLAVARQWLGF